MIMVLGALPVVVGSVVPMFWPVARVALVYAGGGFGDVAFVTAGVFHLLT